MRSQNRLQELRAAHSLSQREFAEKIGVSEATLQNYEYGKRSMKGDVIERVCLTFGVDPGWLLGLSEQDARMLCYDTVPPQEVLMPSYSYAVMPVVGDVAAGEPCEAIELIDQTLTVPEAFIHTNPNARFLRVRGESMNKLFQADSYVLYDPELEVRDGDIAVVYVNGDDATIKRVYFAGDTVVLHPESTMDDFLDRAINTKDPSSPPVTFAGRVFWATWGDKPIKF